MADAVPVVSLSTDSRSTDTDSLSIARPAAPGVTPARAPRRVLHRLDGADELVVVHAGRFGGATTLLRAWLGDATRRGRVLAHVLDPAADTTETRYWTILHAALAGPAYAVPALEGVPGGADSAFDRVVDALARQTAPCTLVLDDLHLVADPVARVDALLSHAPVAGLRILATTRSAREWADRGPRTASQALISPHELCFDPGEISDLLQSMRISFDRRSPEIIHLLTGGLPGLVHPVCASVPGVELAAPTHLDEYAEAVIDREVARALDDDARLHPVRLPLLLSAAAVPLTAGAASPLVDDPEDFLGRVDRGGFARPTGSPTDPEWCYPDAVRASLLRICVDEAPTALREYRMALVRRWLELDAPARALTVAGDLQDWPLAVRIARDNLHTLYTRDYAITMSDEVLARVPDGHLVDQPDLRRLRHVHHQFAAPRDTPRTATDPDGNDEPGTGDPATDGSSRDQTAMFIRALELRVEGDYAGSAHLCDILSAQPLPDLGTMPDQDRESQGFVHAHIGYSYIMTGRFTDALAALRRATRVATQEFLHRDAAGKLALVHVLLGHVPEARAHLTEERRHPALPPVTEALVRPAGDVAATLLALEQCDLDTATAVLSDLGPPADREEFWGFILYAWGRLHLASGTPASGLRFLDAHQPRFAAMHHNGAVAAPLLQSVRADLHLACRQPAAAAEVLSGAGHPLTAAARARLLLLTDDPHSALEVAREAIVDPGSTTRVSLELDLVAAAAALATGDRSQARHHAGAAVLTHRVSGLTAPFRTLPARVMDRVAELDVGLPVDPYPPGPDFGSLTFPEQRPSPAPAAPHPADAFPTGRLTSREQAVLRELATDASIKQIATRAFVSPNTIKSQVRAVYRKLGVTTRAAAIAKAEHLNLV